LTTFEVIMSKIFTRTFRVRFSECNAYGQAGTAHLVRYLVETAWDWGAANQLGMRESGELGLIWPILETEIEQFRPLRYNDSVNLTIWALKWRRVRGVRVFEIRLSGTGELIAQGANHVVCLDSVTMHPIALPDHLLENFLLDDPPEIPYRRFPKAPPPPAGSYRIQRRVEWHDLDSLDHVNHAIYIDYAEEAAMRALAATGWSPARLRERGLAVANRRVHIKYQEPALWGDELDIVTYLSGIGGTGGVRYVTIKRVSDGAGIVKLVADWELADLETGESRPLPDQFRQDIREQVTGAA
jgi:acyl-CoA thioester hydrolase